MMKKTSITALAVAAAMVLTAMIGTSAVSAQSKGEAPVSDASIWGFGPSLVGVWEQANVPMEYDCTTGEPFPGTPTVCVMQTFNVGGTGWIEDTAPVEGPYRSTGATVWKRTSKRGYTYTNRHYSFMPDNTFVFVVKQHSNLTLSSNGNSFTENGQFELQTPDGTVIYTGCFQGTSHRLGL